MVRFARPGSCFKERLFRFRAHLVRVRALGQVAAGPEGCCFKELPLSHPTHPIPPRGVNPNT